MNMFSSPIPALKPLRLLASPLSVICMSKTTLLDSVAPHSTILGRFGNSISLPYERPRPPVSPFSASVTPSVMGYPSCRSYMPALTAPPTLSPFHPFLKHGAALLPWLQALAARFSYAGSGLLIYAWNTLIEVILLVSTAICLKDSKTLIKAKKGVEYRPKRIVHRTLCLDDIIAIKNTIGCTINDVLVGVTSAALSRYLSRRYGGFLPKDLRIRTSLIVNIRRISGINDLADMMKEGSEAKWGNQTGVYLLRLPVIKCEDPLDYVRNGAAITDRKKKSLAAILTHKSFSLISMCLGTKALTVHFQSYLNKIKVVIAVDELAIPDPHGFLVDITDSLQIMKDAVTSAT